MEFDFELIGSLAKNLHAQGNLLGNGRMAHPLQVEQIRFLTEVMGKIKPKHIVETGTHWGGFDYFALLLDRTVKIDTFGINEGSQKAIDILNERFKTDIQFHLGDSCKTFARFMPKDQVDFAWVDGGHDFMTCFTDLWNCGRLRIEHICCDDYGMAKEVRRAIATFLMIRPEYKVQDIDREVDKRRIIYLKGDNLK